MNKLFNHISQARNGHYCHAVEVNNHYEIESIVESIYEEFVDQFTIDDIKEFFNTIQVYFIESDDLSEEQNTYLENEVYSFNFNDYIDSLN